MKDKIYELFSDGGARGNPGSAAYAYVICKLDGTVVKKSGNYLGSTTNNQAEYQGLIAGLSAVAKLEPDEVQVSIDSELIVKQLNGQYRVKNQELLPLYQRAKQLTDRFDKISIRHVPRTLNKLADAEVNRILDEAA